MPGGIRVVRCVHRAADRFPIDPPLTRLRWAQDAPVGRTGLALPSLTTATPKDAGPQVTKALTHQVEGSLRDHRCNLLYESPRRAPDGRARAPIRLRAE